MAIDIIPDTPRNQVRLNIGDADADYIADNVIDALLILTGNNVILASLKAFDIIIAELAKLCDEVTDEVNVKWSQKYANYKQLREDFLLIGNRDVGPRFIIGGTLKSENDKFYNDPDTVKSPVKSGDVLDADSNYIVDPYYM